MKNPVLISWFKKKERKDELISLDLCLMDLYLYLEKQFQRIIFSSSQ